jgi:hypothetical protein
MKITKMLIQKVFDHIFDYNSKLPWLAATVLVDTALKTWQISFYVYAALQPCQSVKFSANAVYLNLNFLTMW